jgi:hypothetical protein
MKSWLHWFAAWLATALQTPGQEFDPELLLQPGGSVLAVGLWLYTKATMGTWAAAGLLSKSKKLPAAQMSFTTDDSLTTNFPDRIDNTRLKVVADWTNCGKLQTCARGGGGIRS